MTKIDIPVSDKVCLTIEEAAAYSSIGTKKLREIIAKPSCPFVLHIGNRKSIIKRKEFVEFLSKEEHL